MPIFCSFVWAHKSDPSLVASDDIRERLIDVFRNLFQQLFGDSFPNKLLLFCKEMEFPSCTYPSQF